MKKLTICVAGKNNIAVDVLQNLIDINYSRFNLCVICNEKRKEIIGWQKSLYNAAVENDIPVLNLEDVYNIENLLFLSMEFDLLVIPSKFINARLFNIHFSLLPAYKGMYTSAIPILNGEKNAGVTLHKIERGIDTGDIIDQIKFKIKKRDTARDLYNRYIICGVKLVNDNIEKLINNEEIAIPQKATGATYYSKDYLDYSNLCIDINNTAEVVDRQIRAFSFREYQLPSFNGKSIIDSKITNIKSNNKAGSIVCENDSQIIIETIDYNIILYIDRFNELLEACEKGNIKLVKKICGCKKHINTQNSNGWTPIIVATYYGHINIVRYLISIGADTSICNYNGTNLLMYAKDSYLKSSSRELFDLFISLGLDPEKKDNYGLSTIDYCKKQKLDLL